MQSQLWSETTLVTDSGRESAALENLLESVEHLGTHSYTFGDALGAYRTDHELLESDRSV